jgi:hypothetical protein
LGFLGILRKIDNKERIAVDMLKIKKLLNQETKKNK